MATGSCTDRRGVRSAPGEGTGTLADAGIIVDKSRAVDDHLRRRRRRLRHRGHHRPRPEECRRPGVDGRADRLGHHHDAGNHLHFELRHLGSPRPRAGELTDKQFRSTQMSPTRWEVELEAGPDRARRTTSSVVTSTPELARPHRAADRLGRHPSLSIYDYHGSAYWTGVRIWEDDDWTCSARRPARSWSSSTRIRGPYPSLRP